MAKKRMINKFKVKKGDTVVILTGRERGKQGKILNVDYNSCRITVAGVNIVRKTVRKTEQYPQGGIIDVEAPVHISNVMLICPKCNKQTRIMEKVLDNGRKVRVCKKCNEII